MKKADMDIELEESMEVRDQDMKQEMQEGYEREK